VLVQSFAASDVRLWVAGLARTDKSVGLYHQRPRATFTESFSAHIALSMFCCWNQANCFSFAHPDVLVSEVVTCKAARYSDERKKRPEKVLKSASHFGNEHNYYAVLSIRKAMIVPTLSELQSIFKKLEIMAGEL
jgi:hypothetical protein